MIFQTPAFLFSQTKRIVSFVNSLKGRFKYQIHPKYAISYLKVYRIINRKIRYLEDNSYKRKIIFCLLCRIHQNSYCR